MIYSENEVGSDLKNKIIVLQDHYCTFFKWYGKTKVFKNIVFKNSKNQNLNLYILYTCLWK